jgi:hypothetical protein
MIDTIFLVCTARSPGGTPDPQPTELEIKCAYPGTDQLGHDPIIVEARVAEDATGGVAKPAFSQRRRGARHGADCALPYREATSDNWISSLSRTDGRAPARRACIASAPAAGNTATNKRPAPAFDGRYRKSVSARRGPPSWSPPVRGLQEALERGRTRSPTSLRRARQT